MTIHREGTATISLVALVVGLLNIANFSYLYPISAIAAWALFAILLGFFLFIVSFFRMPKRNHTIDQNAIVSPADGKVVVIEEVAPDEYYNQFSHVKDENQRVYLAMIKALDDGIGEVMDHLEKLNLLENLRIGMVLIANAAELSFRHCAKMNL